MKESEAWWLTGELFEQKLHEPDIVWLKHGTCCGEAYSILSDAGDPEALNRTHNRGAAHMAIMRKLNEETWRNHYLFEPDTHYEERALACYLLALECEEEENIASRQAAATPWID